MKTLITCYILCCALTLQAQSLSPEKVVQAQLERYNARDIEGFMALMSEEVFIDDFESGKKSATHFGAVESTYEALFEASPDLHSELLNRVVIGNRVIDHEKITGRLGNPNPIRLVVIYTVEKGKINRITVLRED